ncbi:heterokaryon incompatibility protein-domain-containing protein [Schizothecium vesticola]|uniref:Heterokaryon incompatibility protein-domain-containing protein n=1 Tax=Schizothecium vesticola TaxID=314040 RepID=A0AA40F450_9PEZI|nr:heterokaryon incompatibility protein-domain-containing protein [Schizothecium vesticola]
MLYRVLWPREAQSARLVRVFRQGTNLWTDRHSRPLLRLCVDPEWPLRDGEIQVGLPQLLARSSPGYHELLRSWIQRCDDSHENFGCAAASQTALPTRVIDLGANASEDERVVRLLGTNPSQRGRYIALSHCWGGPSEEEREANCTFTSNLTQRHQGINVAQLGKTFQDAIAVTRALGQRYLWIDSLCIIQDDRSDWMRESKCMGAVFSRAYCVIAATAATGPQDGFLRPPAYGFVALPTPWGAPLYLCETVDDFRGDVEHAGLSRRGWVLQERALARRTIHFSSGQTYWECGRGIHCETLTLLNNQEAGFLGDPQFPTLAIAQAATTHTQHHVFQSVFKTYSRLELTRATDRQIAVAGVSQRLAEGMTSLVAFGVFTKFKYLHRSLLWRRAGHVFLHWIRNNTPKVPTWSWMAFMGAIDYVDCTSTEMEWNPHIRLSIAEETATITAPVTTFAAKMLQTPDLLILDYRPRADGEDLKCVIVGKEPSGNPDDAVYYVLVVLAAQGGSGTGTEYERLGVAALRSTHLALDSGTERARII